MAEKPDDPRAFAWAAVIEINYTVGLCPLDIAPLQPEPDRFKGKLVVVAGRRPGGKPQVYLDIRQGSEPFPKDGAEAVIYDFCRFLAWGAHADRVLGLDEMEIEVLNLLALPLKTGQETRPEGA